jgi:hypothetical protein
MGATVVGTVAELWRYPVKSMQGEQLRQAHVTEAGVEGDRAFALIDAETGNIASAKRPSRWGRLLEASARLAGSGAATITLPDGEALATDDDRAEKLLSEFIGRDVRLESTAPADSVLEEVWSPGKEDSPLYGAQAGTDDGQPLVTYEASFAGPKGTLFDFAAIHLVTTSSLGALQAAHADGAVDVRRFRPNLLIEVPDEAGFVENDWPEHDITVGDGGLVLRGLIRTPRCVMTTLAQPDLDRDRGILQTTNRVNRARVFGGEYPCVGVYCSVVGPGAVAVGDHVTVTLS